MTLHTGTLQPDILQKLLRSRLEQCRGVISCLRAVVGKSEGTSPGAKRLKQRLDEVEEQQKRAGVDLQEADENMVSDSFLECL